MVLLFYIIKSTNKNQYKTCEAAKEILTEDPQLKKYPQQIFLWA